MNKQIERSTDKLDKRFKLISTVVCGAFAVTFFLFRAEDEFEFINYAVAFSVWAWLTFDYEILQVDRLYFRSLGLGLAIFLYGLFLFRISDDNTSVILCATTMPVLLVVVQRPLRLAFIRVMKREPVVEKPAPTFADFIYMFILWVITLIVPLICFTG